MFPGADQGFLAGLRGALSDAGVPVDIVVEPVGNCAVKDHVVDKIQRLLLNHSPDLVTGIMGAGLSQHVHTYFSAAGTPFIVNDLGADPIMTDGSSSPFIFSNSLNLWQSMYALGYWASQHLGSRACIAAGLHEAGYGIIHAFGQGFAGAGGGTVLATEVTHRNTADDDPSEHLQRLTALKPDFVMAFYAGREGVSFMRAWSALSRADQRPLIASPLMTHDYWRADMGDAIIGVRTASSWDMGARPEAHTDFYRAARVGAGRHPAVFNLLGYETGRMLAGAVARRDGSGLSLQDALSGVAFSSPRGDLVVDEVTGEIATVDHLQEWQAGPDGPVLVNHGTLPLPAPFRSDYLAVQTRESRSGWINPYLIT